MKKEKTILRSVWEMLGKIGKRFAGDHLSAYAAQATFYLMLAIFPFTMLVCLVTRMLPFLKEETLLKMVRLFVPAEYHAFGTGLVDDYYNENIGSTKIILIIFLIWTASRLMQALVNGFNTAYGITEKRSQTVLRLVGCLYTAALCVMILVLVAMYTLGTQLVSIILKHVPDFGFVELVLKLTRNLASPLLLLLIFWFSYALLPSRKVTFKGELPGAVLTALVWRGAAELYSVFLNLSLERYSYVYGTLTGVVMILIWLYACVYAWFVGAELNWWLRKQKEEEKGFFAELPFPEPAFLKKRAEKRKKASETETEVPEQAVSAQQTDTEQIPADSGQHPA